MTDTQIILAIIGLFISGLGVVSGVWFGAYNIYQGIKKGKDESKWKNYIHDRLDTLEDKITPLRVEIEKPIEVIKA